MQRKMTFTRESDDEEVKRSGLTLDLDEIAKKGSMSREEAGIGKWYGVYPSRIPGNLMARIVVPAGELTTSQVRRIAKTAENYGQGGVCITTRQAVQYHWLKIANLPEVMRELSKEDMTTFHGCGDVTRNTASCQMADNCAYRKFNVLPHARETARMLTSMRDLDNLPRKFKITFSGCSAACAQPYINCLGFIAVTRQKGDRIQKGFKAVIGGGMGWKAFVGQNLFSFIPVDATIATARAVSLLFREYGDRYNRSKSRLKFVVHHKGIDFCREIILQHVREQGFSIQQFEVEEVEETHKVPSRPLTDSNVNHNDDCGLVRIRIPKGELTHLQFNLIADLSEQYGNQRIVTTNRQNLELHVIDKKHQKTVEQKIIDAGLFVDDISGLTDMVACVGTTFCPKAVSTTRDLFDSLAVVVSDDKYKAIRESVIINITGCPNACSPYRISDIGFRGMRIRQELGSVEGYEILIGGDQKKFGQKLVELKLDDCAEATKLILDRFMKNRIENESLTDCVNRLGVGPFMEALA
ncbi:MAG: nitrite/sulfite reductase [Deltaproteobacteria bacterium]|jgi:ferredoxin-nitrite reductase|nr:nitrite/sulfite reductase [Deltaproteobacteria bacterium]MBT4262761.1 nitrite/sulfite reductase [Deltaproteobacteria bacterium]MBT4637278.1 nitrite/sulfite reductase [Deltaproteobacteria bacterium]MBT6502315.1 nitrite/sulfite reductase [Deltaproteobacteria bacterium]MBT6614151.1 nitrite/sulfite reductase [Deltaproteobacteria bacterium]